MKKAEFFRDDVAKEHILHCEDAMDSKDISKDITNFNNREWSKATEELCLPGIRAKFFQNPGLMAALLNTGNQVMMIYGGQAYPYQTLQHWMKQNGNRLDYLVRC